MSDNIDKFFIGGFVILFFLYICLLIDDKKENEYSVIINKNPVKVCGKNIYITDYTYNDEILINELIKEIECTCRNNC